MENQENVDNNPEQKADELAQQKAAEEALLKELEELKRKYDELDRNSNLLLGSVGGMVAGLIAALLWAVITVTTNYQIGWMAIGIGFLVGVGVKVMGKGVNSQFKLLGAALSLVSCVLGNMFVIIGLLSRELSMSISEVVSNLDFELMMKLMGRTFEPMDLLFYGLAIYCGWHFSIVDIGSDKPQQQENR